VAAIDPRTKVTFHVVRADGGPEVAVAMRGGVLTCGKQGDLALHHDPFVAALQARFTLTGPRLVVEDVGGGNGVFLRVKDERELAAGGDVRMGRQRLLVEALAPVAPSSDGTLQWGSPDRNSRFRIIQLLEGGLRGAAFVLKQGDNFVGRATGDVAFPQDGFVSSRHALLRAHAGLLLVRDLGSSNGTFIRLAGPTFVEDGDHFLIGRELFRVQIE